MIPIEDAHETEKSTNNQLANVASGSLSTSDTPMCILDLERSLLTRFPREDAQSWDRTGLLVGDPSEMVKGVCVALDPTCDAIQSCVQQKANVLITHHPLLLSTNEVFTPTRTRSSASARVIWEAASHHVGLMSFHTALDVSVLARKVLPRLLRLDFKRVLCPIDEEEERGYGQLCTPQISERSLTLAQLAARCTAVFGRAPRVWGEMNTALDTIVTATGSAGGVLDACREACVDCLVCGEVKYHAALDASQAGLCIIDLGHDVSELPLAAVLGAAVVDAGVSSDKVTVLDQNKHWTYPESTRI